MHGSSVPATGSFGCGAGDCRQNFAQRRIALSFDAALASGRGRGKGAAAGTATGSGDGEGNDPQRRRASATAPGFVPQARIVRRGGTRRKTPDGRGLAITDPRRAERRWEPYNGKENDSVKSAANRRNPALLSLRRQVNPDRCPEPVRSFGAFTPDLAGLPQLAGHEVRNPLIFLNPTPKGRHYTADDRQRVARRHEESRGAPCAGRIMPSWCRRSSCSFLGWV